MSYKILLKLDTVERDIIRYKSKHFRTQLPFREMSSINSLPQLEQYINTYLPPVCFNHHQQLYGGVITIELESTADDNLFWEWFAMKNKSTNFKNGVIEFYDEDNEDLPFRRLEFWDCWVTNIYEQHSNKDEQMTLLMELSPATIRINKEVIFQKSWWITEINPIQAQRDEESEIQQPKIVSASLWEEKRERAGTMIQYVNLPSELRFVDGVDIRSIDQLGQKPQWKVKFNETGVHNFKVKLIPDTNNAVYSDGEIGRNSNFKYSGEELSFTTDETGEKLISSDQLFVSPAGGDIFSISAKDDRGVEVSSAGKIETRRMMYYVEVKMKGLQSIPKSLDLFKCEYAKHGITFKELPSAEMEQMHNIDYKQGEQNIFRDKVLSAYKQQSEGAKKEPYCTIIAYTDQLAVKGGRNNLFPIEAVGGTSKPIRILATKKKGGQLHALWYNVIPHEDWFVEGYFETEKGDSISITKEQCTLAVVTKGQAKDYYDCIDVDISKMPKVKGTIYLEVNWVEAMYAGLSFRTIVAICTRSWWRNKSEATINQTMIHEVGHLLGMTPSGEKHLDKGMYHYKNDQGHDGNHCHCGIPKQSRYDSHADKLFSKCVMYGASNGIGSFCNECAKAVKKVNLRKGI